MQPQMTHNVIRLDRVYLDTPVREHGAYFRLTTRSGVDANFGNLHVVKRDVVNTVRGTIICTSARSTDDRE